MELILYIRVLRYATYLVLYYILFAVFCSNLLYAGQYSKDTIQSLCSFAQTNSFEKFTKLVRTKNINFSNEFDNIFCDEEYNLEGGNLYLTAFDNHSFDVIITLHKVHKIDINRLDKDGRNLLWWVDYWIKTLIEDGDLGLADGYKKDRKRLIKMGAKEIDTNKISLPDYMKTICKIVITSNFEEFNNYVKHQPSIFKNINSLKNRNCHDNKSILNIALTNAHYNDGYKIFSKLLENTSYINEKNNKGITILDYADNLTGIFEDVIERLYKGKFISGLSVDKLGLHQLHSNGLQSELNKDIHAVRQAHRKYIMYGKAINLIKQLGGLSGAKL